jgi:hypothetical protein
VIAKGLENSARYVENKDRFLAQGIGVVSETE